MGLILNENSDLWQAWLWRMEESIEQLKSSVHLSSKIKESMDMWNETRQREWLTARWMFSHFASIDPHMIQVTEAGKPYIVNDPRYISMSHTSGYVSIATSQRNIGLDIQVKRKDIARIAVKFCAEKDLTIWPNTMPEIDKHHHIWSAKEALFKAYGLGNIDFKEHLIIQNVTQISPESYISEGFVSKTNREKPYTLFSSRNNLLYRAIAIDAF